MFHHFLHLCPLRIDALRRLLLLASLLALAGTAPLPTAAQPAPAENVRPLRLGLYHPHPRLCRGEEPSQRDLRVLRRAFGVGRTPADWRGGPWFYRWQAWPPRGGGRVTMRLETEALWGESVFRLMGGHPDFEAVGAADRLADWRKEAAARLRGVEAAPYLSLAQLQGPSPATDPFLPSRLARSRLLPYLARPGRGPAGGGNGALSADAGQRLVDCRDWPAGVTLAPSSELYSYVLRWSRADGGEPFELRGYREPGVLWRDYFWGRLDALLLEGQDLDDRLGRYRASQLGSWGLREGSQQIVLRFGARLKEALGPAGMELLSQALPRKQLGELEGPGRFAGATAYLEPLLPPESVAPDPGLVWDSRLARQEWLKLEKKPAVLRLAVLPHPLLERLAADLQAQWSRTLNLEARVEVLSVDGFVRALPDDLADLSLEVVDLDDGSLQDLWLEGLTGEGAVPGSTPDEWEGQLRARRPYLPLLINLHLVLLRKDGPPELLGRVCPGCRAANSPRPLAPEPEERATPQG